MKVVLEFLVKVLFTIVSIFQFVTDSSVWKTFAGEEGIVYTCDARGVVVSTEDTVIKGNNEITKITGLEGGRPLSISFTTKKSANPEYKKLELLSDLELFVSKQVEQGYYICYGENEEGVSYFMLHNAKTDPTNYFSQFSKGHTIQEAFYAFYTINEKSLP